MESSTERMRLHRERRAKLKQQQISIYLPATLLTKIDNEAGRRELSRGDVIAERLQAASKSRPKAAANKALAELVNRIAEDRSTPRFGDKAYIAAVWDRAKWHPLCDRFSLESFQARLAKCHVAGILELSRADLVQAMDRALVARSEIRHLGATFHFVVPGQRCG